MTHEPLSLQVVVLYMCVAAFVLGGAVGLILGRAL